MLTCLSGYPRSRLSANVAVSISSLVGTLVDGFSFDAPVASDTIGNTPHSGGAQISLIGLG